MQQMVYVAETNERARQEAKPYFEWYYSTISRLIAPPQGQQAANTYRFYQKSQTHLAKVDMDYLWETRSAAVGDPVRVAEILTMMKTEYGMNHLMAWVGVGGIEHEKVVRSMTLLKQEVLPRVGAGEPIAAD